MRRQFSNIAFVAGISLALAFTLSCSGSDDNLADNHGNTNGSSMESSSSNDGSSSNGMIKKAKITGVFQKGPFIAGTTATLNELDNALNPTGRQYQTLITDDNGSFELRNVELVSPYAHLIASGFYRNEVTGNKSAAPIALQTVVDLRDRDNVNVNILTHLEYYRVLDLVDGGMTVKAAKKQAQKEIFAVFGIDSDSFKDSEDMTIFGTSEADAALLAVSILLLGDLSEADFSQRLMNFAQSLRTGGGWSNEVEKGKIADWAFESNLKNTHCYYGTWDEDSKTGGCWPMPTDDMCTSGSLVTNCSVGGNSNSPVTKVRNNILAWGLSSDVPAYEKYVSDYWASRHDGFEICNASNNYEIKIFDNAALVCKDNSWQRITDIETYCLSGLCDTFTDPRDNQKYKTITTTHTYSKNSTWTVTATVIIEPLRYSANEDDNTCPDGWFTWRVEELKGFLVKSYCRKSN